MRTGIMGGTFDPIHNGHLMLAEYALQRAGLAEVWFMPNGNPPHKLKTGICSGVEDRVAMTELAIRGMEHFRLEPYEADRREVSCTYETMEHFQKCYPNHEFYFIVGADSLFAIEHWACPERIFPACTILAACRDGIDTWEEMNRQIAFLNQKYHAEIELLETPLVPVSSSDVRRRIAGGKPVRGYVPEAVESYIREKGLYGAAD